MVVVAVEEVAEWLHEVEAKEVQCLTTTKLQPKVDEENRHCVTNKAVPREPHDHGRGLNLIRDRQPSR